MENSENKKNNEESISKEDSKSSEEERSVISLKTRDRILWLIVLVIFFGGLVPYATQFVLPFFRPDLPVVGAEVWNQFVSIALGIVATITSIVSLILSLRSEEQSYKTEMSTREFLIRIQDKVISMAEDVKQVSEKQYELNSRIPYAETSERKSTSFGKDVTGHDDEESVVETLKQGKTERQEQNETR